MFRRDCKDLYYQETINVILVVEVLYNKDKKTFTSPWSSCDNAYIDCEHMQYVKKDRDSYA